MRGLARGVFPPGFCLPGRGGRMIRLRGHLICLAPEDATALIGHLDDHLHLSRAMPGCLICDITPTDDPMVFEMIEAFRDRATFDAHQTRVRGSAWFAATRGILRDLRLEEIGD